jgi:hypothetical protein
MRTYVQHGAKSNKNPTHERGLPRVLEGLEREIQQNPTRAQSNKSNAPFARSGLKQRVPTHYFVIAVRVQPE